MIEHWGKGWLDRGYANCRITSPLYDKELFEAKTDMVEPTKANTTLIKSNGIVSANAEVALMQELPIKPIIRRDKLVDVDYKAPQASKEIWKKLELKLKS